MKITHPRFLGGLVSLITIVVTVGSLLVSPCAYGELLFSDSFDYPSGSLDGQGPPPGSPPGQGISVANNHNPTVANFGLDFPGILTAGNCARLVSAGAMVSDEALATIGPITRDVGIAWIGFLMRKGKPSSPNGGFAVVAAIGPSITDPSVG